MAPLVPVLLVLQHLNLGGEGAAAQTHRPGFLKCACHPDPCSVGMPVLNILAWKANVLSSVSQGIFPPSELVLSNTLLFKVSVE